MSISDCIESNPQLKSEMKWLVQRLYEKLPPSYPGFYQRFDVGTFAKENGKDRDTVTGWLNKLISVGAIDREYVRAKTLVRLKRLPLLDVPERISFENTDDFFAGLFGNRLLDMTRECTDNFSIVAHLKNRIGHDTRIIFATGIAGKKYMPLPRGTFDVSLYLQGHANHLYGSSPLREDGTTFVVTFDFDDTQPWFDANHKAVQEWLALAGVASIYAPRSSGRGHLEVVFSSPVNAEMAYSAIVQAAPVLASCRECYPIGPCRARKVSWPFFYRLEELLYDDTVYECQIIAYTPARPGVPLVSQGVKSDRDGVEKILSLAINDASLVKNVPQVVNDAPAKQVHAVIDQDRETFNASHTVCDVLGLRVGSRFISPWRHPPENHASAVIVTEHLVVDYGLSNNPYGKPQCFDAYDCYVAMREGLL